jgi:hypothetical protein
MFVLFSGMFEWFDISQQGIGPPPPILFLDILIV